jgi:3-isopropylmalate/(R)-2-methylmalate dehydratase small subunit
MQPFRKHTGKVAPLYRANIDTDQIIPKQFLKRIEKTGFGEFLFNDWRRSTDGSSTSDFALNQPRYSGASILVTGKNFGCGSSREHAPQAIYRRGIRVVIGQSFSEIFFGNSVALGLPCATAPRDTLDALMALAEQSPSREFVADLQSMRVTAGGTAYEIAMPHAARDSFLDGSWDATGLLLEDFDQVRAVAARLPYVATSW